MDYLKSMNIFQIKFIYQTQTNTFKQCSQKFQQSVNKTLQKQYKL